MNSPPSSRWTRGATCPSPTVTSTSPRSTPPTRETTPASHPALRFQRAFSPTTSHSCLKLNVSNWLLFTFFFISTDLFFVSLRVKVMKVWCSYEQRFKLPLLLTLDVSCRCFHKCSVSVAAAQSEVQFSLFSYWRNILYHLQKKNKNKKERMQTETQHQILLVALGETTEGIHYSMFVF